MSNELTLAASGRFAKSDTEMSFGVSGLQVDVSGTVPVHFRQEIGTSAEALELGDVSTAGFLFVINRDATNFVELRDGAAGADLVKLLAGEFALFRLATSTPYGIADTAAVELECWLFPE